MKEFCEFLSSNFQEIIQGCGSRAEAPCRSAWQLKPALRNSVSAAYYNFLDFFSIIAGELFFYVQQWLVMIGRGGVEDTRLEAKAKDKTKNLRPRPRIQRKSEAKDSLSEDRPSQGQGQECSRPRSRTKDTAASVLQKKSSKKFFRQSPIHRLSQNF